MVVQWLRARTSDSAVRGCELESRNCHLTGHITDPLIPGPLLDIPEKGLMIILFVIKTVSTRPKAIRHISH